MSNKQVQWTCKFKRENVKKWFSELLTYFQWLDAKVNFNSLHNIWSADVQLTSLLLLWTTPTLGFPVVYGQCVVKRTLEALQKVMGCLVSYGPSSMWSLRKLSGHSRVWCWGPGWAECGARWSHRHHWNPGVLLWLVHSEEGGNRRSRFGQDKPGEAIHWHPQVSVLCV